MQARYALRFESGERKGEQVPITGAGVTVGRKPGNSVQLLDASVSGRHAEFVLDPSGVVLRDQGSTNGTRVGGERVSEQRLEHGDEVLLGSVRLTFLDTERPAPAAGASSSRVSSPGVSSPGGADSGAANDGEFELELDAPDEHPSPSASAASAAYSAPAAANESGDAVRTISADKVAKSQKLSKVGALGLLLAVAVGAGGWWWIQNQEQASSTSTVRTVVETPGNRLGAGFSFEGIEVDGEGAAWNNDSAAEAAFVVDSASRASGEDGFGVLVGKSQTALARSKLLALQGDRHFQLSAAVRVDGPAQARIGLEFELASGQSARTVAWSKPVGAADDFQTVEFACVVPPGFDGVRVVLAARATGGAGDGQDGGGTVDIDDVVLVSEGEAPGSLAHESFQMFALGAPPTAAVLFKIDRTLLSDLHVRRADGERAELALTAQENGFAVSLGQGAGRTLSLRADGPLTEGGAASLGVGGYRSHTAEFERDGLTRVILGTGKDLVAVAFDTPVRVVGRAEGAGQRLEFTLSDQTRATVQVVFRAEREAGLALARDARKAEGDGRFGESMRIWTQLRDEAPFDTELLAEGDAARGRLAERGLTAVRELREEVERARFFRLVELYRQCRAQAAAIAERYAGGEVELAAREVSAAIARDLDVLEADLNKHELARLRSIASALDASKNPGLASRVREYASRHFAGGGGTNEPAVEHDRPTGDR